MKNGPFRAPRFDTFTLPFMRSSGHLDRMALGGPDELKLWYAQQLALPSSTGASDVS